jgi:ubiquinone/menaquinone biosynthesis C-methylase UbiE
MIRVAERKAAERQIDVRYQVGLIEEIPFPDCQFDVVVSSLMLHHLPRDLKRRGVAEISRVLRPDGRFVAVDVDPLLMRNLRTVVEDMQANGFAQIRRGRTPFRTMLWRIHYVSGTVR